MNTNKNSITIIFIIIIFSVELISTKTNKYNFLISSVNTEGNAIVDKGDAIANTNSDAAVSLTKDSPLSTTEESSGDQVIALADSSSNSLSLSGNAQSTALSSAKSQEKEITNDLTQTLPNSDDVVLAAAGAQANANTLSGNVTSIAVASSYSDDTILNNSNDNIVSDEGLNVVSGVDTICNQSDWDDLGIKAKAISVNHIGKVYFIGLDGYLYKFELVGKRNNKVKGEIDLRNLEKVTVGPDNSLYVINEYGDAFYLPNGESKNNTWMKLDGCFRDISVSRTGIIYKLGCDYDTNSGFSIYRLICSGNKITCNKVGLNQDDECFWFKLDQKAIRISLSPKGTLYFIDNNAYVYVSDGLETRKVMGIKASDISVSNDGSLFITRILDKFVYLIRDVENLDGYDCIQADAIAIQVGPLNLPFVIADNNSVYFTSKYAFN